MEIIYTRHLALRLRMRGIPEDLPRRVVQESKEHFIDTADSLTVAVLRTRLYGKVRSVAVLYRADAIRAVLITIHPLKPGQLENRVKSGRWKRI